MSNIWKKIALLFIKNLGIFIVSSGDGEKQKIFYGVLFKKLKLYRIEGACM